MFKNARFLTSMAEIRPFEGDNLPQVAMVGKSNVGKSSMINSLLNNKKLARTSAEPGKTRLINLFSVEDSFMLVDLPGFGFARASKDEIKTWSGMIEGYLTSSQSLKLVLQLVDSRHAPTENDSMMTGWLRHYGIPFLIVATKCDKISKAERGRNIQTICRALTVQPWQVKMYSSEDGTGREDIEEAIRHCIC